MKLTIPLNCFVGKEYISSLALLKDLFSELRMKSDHEATVLKEQGNQHYASGSHRPSLMTYNMALLFAESDEQKALLYGNRSAACLEMKMYEECLQNIQMARDHNFPREKLQRLEEREQKCLELMAAKKNVDVSSLYTLSYEPNPKIPFLIDGLKVRTDENNEKGIFATRDFKVGDVICIEESFLKGEIVSVLEVKSMYCSVCSKDRVAVLIPCKTCNFVLLCSEKCQKYHEINECHNIVFTFDGIPTWMFHPFSIFNKMLSVVGGSIEELEKLWKQSQKNPKTVFDFEWNNPDDPEYQKNQLRALFSFKTVKKHKVLNHHGVFTFHPAYNSKREFIKKVILWIFGIVNTVATASASKSSRLSTLSLIIPIIKSSCDSNVYFFENDRKLTYFVTRLISAGEEILQARSKFDMTPIEIRQAIQIEFGGGPCTCVACKNPEKYTLLKDLKYVPNRLLDSAVMRYENFDIDSVSKADLAEMFRELSAILQSSSAEYPHRNYIKGQEIIFDVFSRLVRLDNTLKHLAF